MLSFANLSADCLLEKEKRTHKRKFQLVVTIACHLIWGVTHLVFDLTNKGGVFPHLFVAIIGGQSYYAAELSRADVYLIKLRQEIESRPLLRRRLTRRDYLEMLATGLWVGLGVCGMVEIIDFAFGVHGAGIK